MVKQSKIKSVSLLILSVFLTINSFSASVETKNISPMVIVIDPGHGGKDPGAVNKGIREKDIVLGVGLKLGKLISDNYPDVKVVYTRSSDVFVPLIERSRIANKNKASLFISIHANHCGTPAIRGTETFVLGLHRSNDNLDVAKKENSVILLEENYDITYEGFDPNSSESYIMFEMAQDIFMDQSLSFADAVQQQFKAKIGTPDRGVKQAGFLVLRQSSMPSVLIETGFLSNQAEANYLNSDAGQENLARSIYEAFRKFKLKNSINIPAEKPKAELTATNKPEPKQKTETVTEAKKESGTLVNQAKETPKKEDLSKDTSTSMTVAVQNKVTEVVNKTSAVEIKPAAVATTGVQDTYFSVQIAASTSSVEPIPANFKGLKNVRREKTDKYYRYFVGNEPSVEKLSPTFSEVKRKFPEAFIVSFTNGVRTIVK